MFPKVRANIEISMIPGVMRLQLEALTTKFAKGVLSLKLSHSRLRVEPTLSVGELRVQAQTVLWQRDKSTKLTKSSNAARRQ